MSLKSPHAKGILLCKAAVIQRSKRSKLMVDHPALCSLHTRNSSSLLSRGLSANFQERSEPRRDPGPCRVLGT